MKLTCQQCLVEYKSLGRHKNQKYCSQKCYALARIVEIPTSICPSCNKEFQWTRAHKPQKYCSIECKADSQRIDTTRACEQCGKIYDPKCQTSKRKYCSRICSNNGISTKITVNCQVCDKETSVRALAYTQGFGKYCSNNCRYLGTKIGQNRSWKAGYREDLGDIYFRSSWEANYSRVLNYLMEKGLVRSWEFETKVFELEDNKVYIPDFIVTGVKGTKTYHEVKGWMDERSIEKLTLMKKLHSEVPLVLVDTDKYKFIEKEYSMLIPNWEYKNG